MMARVLIVEDDPAIRLLLRRSLERSEHSVTEAADARTALAALVRECPDLVLLDLGLPDRDGLELIPAIKASGAALLVVSAREATAEKVAALDLGADDYITKPFDAEELRARVRTALRHRAGSQPPPSQIKCGDMLVDLDARRVTMKGQDVHLAPKEFGVLAELGRNAGKVLTHSHLLRTVWGPAHLDDIEYLRVTIRAIRRKLGEEPQTSVIRNEPAVGYRLVPPS